MKVKLFQGESLNLSAEELGWENSNFEVGDIIDILFIDENRGEVYDQYEIMSIKDEPELGVVAYCRYLG